VQSLKEMKIMPLPIALISQRFDPMERNAAINDKGAIIRRFGPPVFIHSFI
jgi:hypothetical protein